MSANPNPMLLRYYNSFEARIGYRLFLGGTRHFGFYETDSWWPFPIAGALRRMEDHLYRSLGLESGAQVLDAGCGIGHVAIHLAKKGLRIHCVDLVDRHIQRAKSNIAGAGLDHVITVRKGNFQDLNFSSDTLDGVYTMETLVHTTDPAKALEEFFRVLKPGGSLALYEYDNDLKTQPKSVHDAAAKINKYSAMPANAMFGDGTLVALLEGAEFEDITVKDLSVHIRPMLRLFFVFAYVPYLLITLLGLEPWFVSTFSAVHAYRGRHYWRYVAVTARKPGTSRASGNGRTVNR
jgi:ubiquinone/menaquinone biosynthesis C-methylase UbiE